jgi:hypothetical protein
MKEARMSSDEAAEQRFTTLVEAFDFPDPDDEQAMREFWFAGRRFSEQVAMEIMRRPDLPKGSRGCHIPEAADGGPATAAQSLLWDLCVTYDYVGGLLRAFVLDERILTVPISSLRGDARLN